MFGRIWSGAFRRLAVPQRIPILQSAKLQTASVRRAVSFATRAISAGAGAAAASIGFIALAESKKSTAAPAAATSPAAATPTPSSEPEPGSDPYRFSASEEAFILSHIKFDPATDPADYEVRIRALIAHKYGCPCMVKDMAGPCAVENFRFWTCAKGAERMCTPAELIVHERIAAKLDASQSPDPAIRDNEALTKLTPEEEKVLANPISCLELTKYVADTCCEPLRASLDECELRNKLPRTFDPEAFPAPPTANDAISTLSPSPEPKQPTTTAAAPK